MCVLKVLVPFVVFGDSTPRIPLDVRATWGAQSVTTFFFSVILATQAQARLLRTPSDSHIGAVERVLRARL